MDNKKIRKKILEILYENAEISPDGYLHRFLIEEELGISGGKLDFNMKYLLEKGYVKFTKPVSNFYFHGAQITLEGIELVEDSKRFNFMFLSDDIGIDTQNSDGQIKAFISYSTENKDVGAEIKKILSNFEIKSFLAHNDIEVSERWRKRILRELREANVFISILSKNFKESDWCSQEAGIACFRDILFIPLSIDKTIIPYGFMEEWQGKSVSAHNIPVPYLINPIADKFPEINIFSNLINELSGAKSFRNAESIMNNLEPYFDKLSDDEVNRVIDVAIANNQIWDATKCKIHYLPNFIEVNKDKIDEDKLKVLAALIKYDID